MTGLSIVGGGGPVALVSTLASSGEGIVSETDAPALLAKVYHRPDTARIDKIRTMIARPPADPMRHHGHRSIAWPQRLIEADGRPVGFLMPYIRDALRLTTLYNPRLRRQRAPGFDWYCLHVVAHNVAWIVRALHDRGYVIGDLKTDNLLVTRDALVSIIDTDSFQVRDPATGRVHRCAVGSEGFTPPELIGLDLGSVERTELHDRFGLAVIVHLLLLGSHPFQGHWEGEGDPPPLDTLIRFGDFPYARASRLHPGPLAVGLEAMHPALEAAMRQTFEQGHGNPHRRPSAAEWCGLLTMAMDDLLPCGDSEGHFYSATRGVCPWCIRRRTTGYDLFPPAEEDQVPRAVFVRKLHAALAKSDDRAVARLWGGLPWLRALSHAGDVARRSGLAVARMKAVDRIVERLGSGDRSLDADEEVVRLWHGPPDLAASGAAIGTEVAGRPLVAVVAACERRVSAARRLQSAIAAARSGGRLTVAGEEAVVRAHEDAAVHFADRREALARYARRVDQARQRLAAWQGLTAAVNAGATDLALQVWRVAGPLFTDFAPAVTLAPHIDALRRGSVAARKAGQGRGPGEPGRAAAGGKGPARRSDE